MRAVGQRSHTPQAQTSSAKAWSKSQGEGDESHIERDGEREEVEDGDELTDGVLVEKENEWFVMI